MDKNRAIWVRSKGPSSKTEVGADLKLRRDRVERSEDMPVSLVVLRFGLTRQFDDHDFRTAVDIEPLTVDTDRTKLPALLVKNVPIAPVSAILNKP